MTVTDEPFWREQRRRQFKSRKAGFEKILSKCFKENMKEYVKQCSLSGIKQMFEPGISAWQRLLWTAVFVTGGLTCGFFLLYTWSEALDHPLIVTLESSTYPISNVLFPAVAICNVNLISKKALHLFATENYKNFAKKNESLEEVESFLLHLGCLLDFSYNESMTRHSMYTTMSELYRKDTHKIVDIMKRLAPSCQEMLVSCAWAGRLVDCKQVFATRRTTLGHCCTFNFILDYDKSGRPSSKSTSDVKKQNKPSYLHGLNVILDPLMDDYAYPLSNVQGFDILVFQPSHFPDVRAGRVVDHLVEPNAATYMELHATTQKATAEVRKYSTETRSCLFRDESEANSNFLYSYSTCIVRCRVMTLLSLCKCTPYFINIFIRAKEENVCTLDDLRCLNKYKEKLWYLYPYNAKDTVGLEVEMEESLSCPGCLPDCELTKHDVKSFATPLYVEGYPDKAFLNAFVEPVNMTNKSFLSIYSPVPDSTLNRLDIVNYWYQIISNVGGFGGIILGFSAISMVEIIYFCCIRYFICVFKKCLEQN